MLNVNKLIPGGRGLASAVLARAGRVTLDWDSRQKSRVDAVDSSGRRLAIVLPRGSVLRHGDVLVADDGALLVVQAASQPLMLVRSTQASALSRAAYHLGNRHVQVDIRDDSLRFEPDHVLADMLRGMGFEVASIDDGFEPEGGAYSAHGDAHDHGHGHHHDDHEH